MDLPKRFKELMYEVQKDAKIVEEKQLLTCGGWVRSCRKAGKLLFLQLYDGSEMHDFQAVAKRDECEDFATLKTVKTGYSVRLTGYFVESPGAGQTHELVVTKFEILGECPADYIHQKKTIKEGDQDTDRSKIRQFDHLRTRTRTDAAIQRISDSVAYSIHTFYRKDCKCYWWRSPLITYSDCEGAGETWVVEQKETKGPEGDVSYDFFRRKAFLTVSGQLEGEDGATGLGRIYTFGPTFRREHSKTTSHLAEFWMVEPEFAGWWVDKYYLMSIAEASVQFTLKSVLAECEQDLLFLEGERGFDKPGMVERLQKWRDEKFIRISYTKAIEVLEDAVAKGVEFEFPVSWGIDLAKEHERYLTDTLYKKPVFVYDFPTEIKSFYMKKTDETGKTVGAFDLLVPGVGELVGGSERESDLEKLKQQMESRGMDLSPYESYLDLRKYGTVPHGGFGIGFERLILFITGAPSIRDCIPYPRYYEH